MCCRSHFSLLQSLCRSVEHDNLDGAKWWDSASLEELPQYCATKPEIYSVRQVCAINENHRELKRSCAEKSASESLREISVGKNNLLKQIHVVLKEFWIVPFR
jgi:hypothetical protein